LQRPSSSLVALRRVASPPREMEVVVECRRKSANTITMANTCGSHLHGCSKEMVKGAAMETVLLRGGKSARQKKMQTPAIRIVPCSLLAISPLHVHHCLRPAICPPPRHLHLPSPTATATRNPQRIYGRSGGEEGSRSWSRTARPGRSRGVKGAEESRSPPASNATAGDHASCLCTNKIP
jgi:hypothetical protein